MLRASLRVLRASLTVRLYPAIDVSTDDPELVYPLLDDYAPSAIEERDDGLRAFFSSCDARDAALRAMSSRFPAVPVDVPDQDWARRSQENLSPVRVGRITIHPNRLFDPNAESSIAVPGGIEIVIAPSMGFGTGHHATTRLCLAAMQDVDVRGRAVLDVGTGSGVLAIAAIRLGAARALGIDNDPDAIQAAHDNRALNPQAPNVAFACADLSAGSLPPADILTANLTGALLMRAAGTLLAAVRSGGILILSGLLADERDAVVRAFDGGTVVWERTEDEWVGLAVKKS